MHLGKKFMQEIRLIFLAKELLLKIVRTYLELPGIFYELIGSGQ